MDEWHYHSVGDSKNTTAEVLVPHTPSFEWQLVL